MTNHQDAEDEFSLQEESDLDEEWKMRKKIENRHRFGKGIGIDMYAEHSTFRGAKEIRGSSNGFRGKSENARRECQEEKQMREREYKRRVKEDNKRRERLK